MTHRKTNALISSIPILEVKPISDITHSERAEALSFYYLRMAVNYITVKNATTELLDEIIFYAEKIKELRGAILECNKNK